MNRRNRDLYSFFPVFVRDYEDDAGYLKAIEHGAYLLLLFHYWKTGSPLPDDDDHLAHIARATPDEWSNIKPRISKFFKIEDGVWWHKRVEAELEIARSITKKKQEAANKRWGVKSNVIAMPRKYAENTEDEPPF